MKKKVTVEWAETQWCTNTVEIEVPDDIPADEVEHWIEDHIWEYDLADGMTVDDVEVDDHSTTIVGIE